MVDGLAVANWEALILRQIARAPFCELALFVVNDERPPRRSRARRLWSGRRHLAYRLYSRIDARIYGRPDDAFARVGLEPEFAGVPRLHTTPLRPRPFEHRFDDRALDAIRAAGLDVILRFGFNIIRGEILEAARCGVWSFHHGDNRLYRGTPAFFWEMYEGNPVSGTLLQRLTDELDGGGVLYRSWSATHPVSLRRGRNGAFWKSAHFVMRRLRDVHERGWDYVEQLPVYTERCAYDRPIYRMPSNRQVLRLVARIAAGVALRRLRRLAWREQWFIAYKDRGDGPLLGPAFFEGLRIVQPPPDRYWADPFLTSDAAGGDYVLVEEVEHRRGKGVICALDLGVASPGATRRLALEREHHLSYPFAFESGGATYMVPESSAARTIELYRAERVPDRWVHERVLMAGVEAADTTIFEHDGLLWMFTSLAVDGAPSTDELFVFWATTLDGEWTPHPRNPVVSDVRCARPAGRVSCSSDGRILRPAQDCSSRYGGAIVICRVDVLTTTDYRETAIGRLEGEWAPGVVSTHTYDVGPRHEVIDGLRARPRLALPRLGALRRALQPRRARARS